MNYRRYTRRRLSGGSRFFLNSSVTNLIVLINVVVFVASFILIFKNQNFFEYIALKPANIFQGKYLWTLITSTFMHANLTHLFVNMISLLFIGNFLEKIIGRKRFFWFYLISGLIASFVFVLLALIFPNELDVFAVGASGAIFGLGGLLMILTPNLPVLVFFIIPMKMWKAMLVLLFGLWAVSLLAGLPIGNTAHFGGFIAGLIYGLYLKKKYKRKVMILNKIFR